MTEGYPITFSRLMVLGAVICFVLAMFLSPHFNLIALGLALWAGSALV